MQLTLLGTGNAGHLPMYGCNCNACERARTGELAQRNKTSAVIEANGKQLLLDANAPDLLARFPPGSIDRILLTHYHMDHVQSLFDLRWGKGELIPVDGPDEPQGCDDLFKHPGLLVFQPPLQAFEPFEWQGLIFTPVPLNHSKVTLGYVIENPQTGKRIAYLTDTIGLPRSTEQLLIEQPVDLILIDCSYPPAGDKPVRNHNDLDRARDIFALCKPRQMGLLHISHTLQSWALDNPQAFDEYFFLAADGQSFEL